MMKLTGFELMEVVTEDGKRLGRVFDLRAHGRPNGRFHQEAAQVDALVYGTLGLLERLGIRKAAGHTIGWDRVVDMKDRRIVVRASASKR